MPAGMNDAAKVTLTVFMMLEKALKKLGPKTVIEVTSEELDIAIRKYQLSGEAPHNVEFMTAMDPTGFSKTFRTSLRAGTRPEGRNRYIDLSE